jgi:hypothetical protein
MAINWSEMLNQTEHWDTDKRGRVLIKDMTASHRLNTVGWLETNAPQIAMNVAWKMGYYEDASDGVYNHLSNLESEMLYEPLQWMKSTPLYKAMLGI